MGKLFIEEFNGVIIDKLLCSKCFANKLNIKLINKDDILGKISTLEGDAFLVENMCNVFEEKLENKGLFANVGDLTIFDNEPLTSGNVEISDLFCNKCENFIGFKLHNEIEKYICLKDSLF